MLSKLLLAAALLVPATGLTACGLIDSDVTQFDLGLPDKQFTIDAGNWGLSNPEQLLAQQCTTTPNDPCPAPAAHACRPGQCVAA